MWSVPSADAPSCLMLFEVKQNSHNELWVNVVHCALNSEGPLYSSHVRGGQNFKVMGQQRKVHVEGPWEQGRRDQWQATAPRSSNS